MLVAELGELNSFCKLRLGDKCTMQPIERIPTFEHILKFDSDLNEPCQLTWFVPLLAVTLSAIT